MLFLKLFLVLSAFPVDGSRRSLPRTGFSLNPKNACVNFLSFPSIQENTWRKTYQGYQRRFLEVARLKIDASVELADFYFDRTLFVVKSSGAHRITYYLRHPRVSGRIAKYIVGVVGSTMSFDIEIFKSSEFEKSGLYGLLLGRALLEHPGINRLPAMRMGSNDSKNMRDFIGHFAPLIPRELEASLGKMHVDSRDLVADLQRLDPDIFDRLRKAIIESLEAVPAVHVRRRYGFSNITSVAMGSNLNIAVDSGEPTGSPRVYLQIRQGLIELKPKQRPYLERVNAQDLKDFRDYKPE